VCCLLARKQARYPVFLLTEVGRHSTPLADVRALSLAAAAQWATEASLFGVVTDVRPLLVAPRLAGDVQWGRGATAPLVLATYGRSNNEVPVVAMQLAAGVGAVIVDHVHHVVAGLGLS